MQHKQDAEDCCRASVWFKPMWVRGEFLIGAGHKSSASRGLWASILTFEFFLRKLRKSGWALWELMTNDEEWWTGKNKKWKALDLSGIVEFGVLNVFEENLYGKWSKSYSGMYIWSIEIQKKSPIRSLVSSMLCLIWTQKCFPERMLVHSNLLCKTEKSTLRMFWTIFRDPSYTSAYWIVALPTELHEHLKTTTLSDPQV